MTKENFEYKQLLNQIKKEIKKLEWIKNNPKLYQLQVNSKKAFIIIKELTHYLFPFIGGVAIFTKALTLINNTPFIIDEEQKETVIKTVFDSLGNKKEDIITYDENLKSTLVYYSKWVKNDDKTIIRKIKKYHIKDETLKEARTYLDKDDHKLESVIGFPYEVLIEKKGATIPLDNKDYIEITIIDKKTKKSVIYKETVNDNTSDTCIYLIILTIMFLLNHEAYKKRKDSTEIKDELNKCKVLDKEIINKKLELKKDNYERLTR